jgi:hypothetical protein
MNIKDIERRLAALEEIAKETEEEPVIVRFAIRGDPEGKLTEWPIYRSTRESIEYFDPPDSEP